ncbi:hexokinase-2, chloroplastic isoform X2 [Amborella trichopoda]|uniref:hexokinase-2, chloroplastic isoform X2 n=1 Tax=Amborella trichopoda TaxID=13333 RepID=UPI0009BEFD01|nr:hexokinase-2, chloroplastic isoform X2 [Amborella trichopoda]|eukprot:XP_020517427.1 hexokinase-2, chloroplastic isoform X2 [Amborella trichopoda]
MAALMIPANTLAAKRRMRVRSSASRKDHAIVKEFREGCAAPLPVLRRVAEGIAADMRKGLNSDGGHSLPMIPTFVNTLPSGNEEGLFYALDLGGTNFRVLRVQLGGKDGRVIDTEFEQVAIPQDLMFGTSEELFDFIASRLGTFVQKESGKFHLPSGRLREIGFTFSFPVKQTSIDSGILIKWTKGFAVSGTVNDTVGTLAGARYWDDDAMVAVILGTGTNACYVERMDCIPKLQGHLPANGDMIINTEWGAFHDSLPLTEFDKALDAASINPGEQILEKTISGMYLGEVARRVFLKMAESGAMFGGSAPDKLSTPFVLRTPHLCAMQQDQSSDLKLVGKILSDTLGVDDSSLGIREMAIDICDAIVKRGGRLAGAGIVGILQKMDADSKGTIFRKRTVVAMDGGLYENYPHYRKYIKEAVIGLLGSEISKNVVIEHSKDGSGIGAALLAAANSKYAREF